MLIEVDLLLLSIIIAFLVVIFLLFVFLYGFERCGNWLTTNQIFFQTILTVALSLMAIIVAFGANDITTRQTQIMEFENQPHFVFTFDKFNLSYPVEYPRSFTTGTAENLIVNNIGKPFKNLTAESKCFISVIYRNSSSDSRKYVFIPIQYYIISAPGTSPNGEFNHWLFSGAGNENVLQSSDIGVGFVRYIRQNQDDIRGFGVKQFVKLNYDDIFGKPHEDYFYIAEYPITQPPVGIQLSKDDWDEISRVYSNRDFYVNIDPIFLKEKKPLL